MSPRQLWAEFAPEPGVLALARWPGRQPADAEAYAEIGALVEIVGAIRSVRSEMNVPNAAKTELVALGGEGTARLARHVASIERLARIEGIRGAEKAPPGSAQIVVGGVTYALPLAGIIDFAAERARLEKEAARIHGEIARIDKKLANENFVARAPEEVVDAEREKRAAYAADAERLAAALKRVKEAG